MTTSRGNIRWIGWEMKLILRPLVTVSSTHGLLVSDPHRSEKRLSLAPISPLEKIRVAGKKLKQEKLMFHTFLWRRYARGLCLCHGLSVENRPHNHEEWNWILKEQSFKIRYYEFNFVIWTHIYLFTCKFKDEHGKHIGQTVDSTTKETIKGKRCSVAENSSGF
jgi:hypothetical protein